MKMFDIKADMQQLLQESAVAIQEFAAVHPETISFLAYGVNYYEGWISLNLDTATNSVKQARRRVSRIRLTHQDLLQRSDNWRDARYYLNRDRMSGVCMEIGDFQHYLSREWRFEHWADYFADLPEQEDGSGHFLILFLEVIRGLTKRKAFQNLTVSSPFFLGVQFIDDDLGMVIMDILNWPDQS
jgi:hypothetical protein